MKPINPSDTPDLLMELTEEIESLKVRISKLEDRTYEEVDDGPGK